MTFSLISVAVLLITALVILIEVLRAINRGRSKTLVTLASLFLAIFISILVTTFLSNLLAESAVKFIKSSIDLSAVSDKIASADEILYAYADSIISPVLFFLVFLLARILIAIVVKIVYSANKRKNAPVVYESEEARKYKKNPRLTNGLLGALCGFLVMVVAISPFIGSLKSVTKTFKGMNEDPEIFNLKFNDSIIVYFDGCSRDIVGNVLYYCGGNLIYRSVASSELNDNYFSLGNEIDRTFETSDDLLAMTRIISNIEAATPEEKEMLRHLGAEVDKAETLKRATADILPNLAKKWLNDEASEGISKPKVSKASEAFFDKMLYVCKSSTPDTVGDDLSTLLNVYLIAYENNILVSENYKEMIELAKATGAFESIKQELNKNRRMAGISLDVDNVGMKSIATAIQTFNIENYDILMNNITGVLNNALNLEGQERLDYVTNMTKGYINQYGIDLGDDVADEVANRLIDELIDGKKTLSTDDIKEFWDKYSVKAKDNLNNLPQSTPQPSLPNVSPIDPVEDEELNNETEIPSEDAEDGYIDFEDTGDNVYFPDGSGSYGENEYVESFN